MDPARKFIGHCRPNQWAAKRPLLLLPGQAHHFRQYAPEQIPYAVNRYVTETRRLYGVLNRQLAGRDFVAGA